MLTAGSRLASYEILDVLGRGVSATTYRARHAKSGREVALKVPHRGSLTDSTFVVRFLQEGALGSSLTHRSIVRVLEAGEDQGLLFIAMELVDGVPLDRRLATEGALPLRDALRIAHDVAEALDFAHRKGVVHRNLKPNHVMLLAGGGVKVVDLGVARAFGDVSLTSSDVFLGAPAYAPPEADDPHALDHRSDLYSLGIILFEMIEGRLPFEADSMVELVRLHQERHFPTMKELARPVPRVVWNLMDRLCRKRPEDRPQSASEAVDKLARMLAMASLDEE